MPRLTEDEYEKKVKTHPLISDAWSEKALECGVWAYPKAGYTGDIMDAHVIHEDTWCRVYQRVLQIVPCPCDDCKKGGFRNR